MDNPETAATPVNPITVGKLRKIYLLEPNPVKQIEPDYRPPLIVAWENAIKEHFGDIESSPFEIIEARLGEFDPAIAQSDCMVSPANSFGIMDGGYDLALSRAFKGPSDKFHNLSDHIQSYLHKYWKGYIPPGSCHIVPLPPKLAGDNNPWKARTMAVVPTMRVPDDVTWHQDLVYNSMWCLLVAVDNWNKEHTEGAVDVGSDQIQSMLMTGLGTGTGGVGSNKCAQQMVLATKHFIEGLPAQLRWEDVAERQKEILKTIELKD